MEELKCIVENGDRVLIVGYFNAHLEKMDGRRNWNGELMRELIEEGRMKNVNKSEKGKGKNTWERGNGDDDRLCICR